MEYALVLSGTEQARLRRLGRKRALQDKEPSTPSSVFPTPSTPPEEQQTNVDIDDTTRRHICASISLICENTHTLSSGKSFVARSTLGAFLAVQAAAPQPLGPIWAALLYVCFETVYDSYTLGISSPRRADSVHRIVLTDIIKFLGASPKPIDDADPTPTDNELVKGCRRWSRFETPALLQVVEQAWSITELPKVRMAMEGVLSNCASAKYLFP
mgnify:FL=1|tara:strand:- start:293 stop:934 length:642 start_codon:yes stop_codon:yes gene_type:complete